MSRPFSLTVLGMAVWLLAASAVLAEEKPRDKPPQTPAAKVQSPPAGAVGSDSGGRSPFSSPFHWVSRSESGSGGKAACQATATVCGQGTATR